MSRNILLIFVLFAAIGAISSQGRPREKSQQEEEEIFYTDVDQFPYFDNCSNQACSNSKLIQFLSQHLAYPIKARRKGTQGVVYVEFVIEKNGSMSGVRVIKGLKDGCGLAALNTVKKMKNKWSPGINNGEPVRVQYTLPITFKLTKK